MAVQLWLRDDLDTILVRGSLNDLTNLLNTARGNGLKYAILNQTDDQGVMIEMTNITKARETEEDYDSFIGGN